MAGHDTEELRAELQIVFVDPEGRRHFIATATGRPLAQISVAVDQGWLRVVVADDEAPALAEWQGVLRAVKALADSERRLGVVLAAGSPLLLRHAARTAGFTGSLRGDLARAWGVAGPDAARQGTAPHGTTEDRFVSEVNSLLPGVTVSPAHRPAGWLRSALRSASTGVVDTAHLTVRDASVAKPLSLAVPLSDDVMAECVAVAVDTALAVRRRFHPLVDRVRMFYDQAVHGLRTGTVAGLAEASVRDVHLNPGFALASEMEILERQRQERRLQPPPGRRPPLGALPPFTRIDLVVAHELWHQIEFGFESSRYRDSVEFRRAVGGYFGVETLEHVIKGGAQGAPQAWQVARARLAGEVSAYATTNPKEASAELFAQWWCTPAAPPPSARFFGEVVQRFFPAAGTGGG